ncbi:MAG: aconitate hydratase [Clostridia bacterium]|nr:aconitate hydratase [Clostridia bacterium]
MNLTQKIIKAHLVSGQMNAGEEIAIRIDQTLTQDSTGTMAYLQFEATGVDKVKTERSVAYIDHNMLQASQLNADDHAYIQSVALSHGIYVSKPGNGICHQVHLERFGKPGKTLLGSDSHTPTGGGIGMLAIGAGGLDVALAMGGAPFYLIMPKVVNIELKGQLKKGVTAKDIILKVLEILTTSGGVGKVMEYTGEGLKYLTVPERATITNMGAELGATTSVFPSDETTLAFLKAQGREADYVALSADADATYDEHIVIDLNELAPLAACPHSPGNVKPIAELAGKKVDQICIGSCTNSSYLDLMKVAKILKGKTVAPNVSLTVSPGSRQVLTMLAENGALADIISSGARILECACGPCIGNGQSPKQDAVSLRTFNRNFFNRSGTPSADVYLVSPETAAVSALTGVITSPEGADFEDVAMPEKFLINDNLILKPDDFENVEIVRGDNIKPFPKGKALARTLEGEALIKLGDDITTDHIMPSNAALLAYRSNIPYLSDYCLSNCDKEFPARAKKQGGGFIVAGSNYGQGSSREHAALVPLYLGIKAVVAKSFARIHKDNLMNNGILPLVFVNADDYESISEGDKLRIDDAPSSVMTRAFTLVNETTGKEIPLRLECGDRQQNMLICGGSLNSIKH